jgi:hypothetical protein
MLVNVIRGVTLALYAAVRLMLPVHHHTTNTERTRMACSEADKQWAINEYHSGLYASKQPAAQANSMPPTTLRYRFAGRTSHAHLRGIQQILSNAEEKTLLRWVTRSISTG